MKGSIIRRGERSWRLKFDLGRDGAGKRQTRYHTVRGTKKEAEAEMVRLINEANHGNYVDPSKATVADFFERWDRDWATDNLSPKTIERYREYIRLNIKPNIGSLKLQKLRAVDLSELYAKLLREGAVKNGGLAPRTVGHIHRVIHRALGHAAQWALVQQNVATIVNPPKVVAPEVEILTVEQIRVVLKGIKDAPIYQLVVMALATGMRRGELLALRWGDLDLTTGMVRVERSLEETEAGRTLRFKEPKTKHGRRNLSIPASVVGELRRHWTAQQERRLALGMGKASPSDLVFPNVNGGPQKPNVVTGEWRRLIKARALPQVSFHAWRHTHVSQLIASGMDVLTISRRIGHSNPNITLGVYGHLFKNTDSQAALVIEAAFGLTLTE